MCDRIDRFSVKLTPPKIIKVIKEGNSALIEWYHNNTDIKDYVLLYVDVEKMASGVWVQNNITCKTRRCRIPILNLPGSKYKLTVLSRLDNKLSDITQNDIITFSDTEPYEGVALKKGDKMEAEGDNEPLPNFPSVTSSNNQSDTDSPSMSGESSNGTPSSSPAIAPSPAPVSTLDCTGGYVKLHNIKNKEELEDAKMEPECQELEDLSQYMKKPWYHKYLDRVF